ncbi:hypothetical protein C3L33_07177, partial [Rhododendron williamsianum]
MLPPTTLLSLSSILLLLSLLLPLSSSASSPDAATMTALLSLLSPAPSGWTGTNPCTWTGVSCDSSARVTSINLASKSISGSLPSTLNTLSHLTSLSLQNNLLSGPLPSLSNLTSLQQVYLDNNKFTSVPTDFLAGLTSLQTLSLSQNAGLSPWTIPDELTQSSSLTTLSASSAGIVGSVPDFFSSFPNLQNLRLSYNNLTGYLPPSFGGSGQSAHRNRAGLSDGSSEIGQRLVENNELQGPMPVFGSGVTVILGGTNSFCRTTPGPCDPQVTALISVAGALGYPITLAESWQGNNASFLGTISPAFTNLTSLRSLFLNDNNLTGSIPEILTSLSQLQVLDVSNNNLSGPIPDFGSSVKFTTTGNLFLGTNVTTGAPPGGGTNSTSTSGSPAGTSNGSSTSAATGRVTTKVDVYAFGVVLMEIITGRKSLDESMPEERCHLVTWFRRVLINKDNLEKAIDQTLDPDKDTYDSISKVAELAGHCTAREPFQRPDMGHAVNVLGPLVEEWKPSGKEEEEDSGIDFHMSLPQALQRWQANEGTSTMFSDSSYSQTQSSIPSKPFGFADSFDSTDCR